MTKKFELNEALDYAERRLLIEIAAHCEAKRSRDLTFQSETLKLRRDISQQWAEIVTALVGLAQYREGNISSEVERIKERYEYEAAD